MKISFVWYGITKRKDQWRDGLWAAMQLLEKKYQVEYCEPTDEITGDVILFWEAPCTINSGENAKWYNRIHQMDKKKILLFAGGPIQKEWVENFDLLAVESAINAEECEKLDIPHVTAFGVNTDIFKPLKIQKKYITTSHGTCASWKRQWLICQAMGEKALVFGQEQDSDPRPFAECRTCNSIVLPEQSYAETVKLINSGYVSVNCADFWGGGQRQTLEAMACNIPVVVMSDSPKNREYVQESDGIICEPNEVAIRNAVLEAQKRKGQRGYVMSKWTHKHYAKALDKAIQSL